MNKYQESLDSLYDDIFDKNVWGFVRDGDNLSCSDVERARKFYKDTLQELVDKSTSKKPKVKHYENKGEAPYVKYTCPNDCGIQLSPVTEKIMHTKIDFVENVVKRLIGVKRNDIK